MLRGTDTPGSRQDYVAPVGAGRSNDTSLRGLYDRLRQLGFEAPPLHGVRRDVAGGVPLRLAVPGLLRATAGSGPLIGEIRTLLRDNTPFTLILSELGRGDAAISALQRVCELLQAEIAGIGQSGRHVGICMHADQLPLQAFRLITNCVPGNGPRYVLLHRSQMPAPGNQRRQSGADRFWSFLWRQSKGSTPLIPAYGDLVRTACPLLGDEVADSIMPACGIQVPADSAWLPVTLALPRFADDGGAIRWERLERTLTHGVAVMDRIVDRLHWSRAAQKSDAQLNRRLAISITGLGDLVLRRKLEPQDLDTLRWLSAIVVRLRKILWRCSAELACQHGCLPALFHGDPSRGWADSAHREMWRQRWQKALEKSAVRHRNMLVISPCSVLPAAETHAAAYTDLLPVIACADAWSFTGVPHACNWNCNEYKTFHRRAWAVIERCKTGTFVAAGV